MPYLNEDQPYAPLRGARRIDRLYRVVGALTVVIAALIAPQDASAQEARPYTVVAATSLAAKGFDETTLARVMLGRTRRVAGNRISVVMIDHDAPAMKAFLTQVVDMGPRRFKTYWRKRLFSSRGTPPRVVNTVGEALEIVVRAPGTVAVLPADTVLPAGVHAVAYPAPVAPVIAPAPPAPVVPITAPIVPVPAPIVPVPAPIVPVPAPIVPAPIVPVPPVAPAPPG